MCHFLSIISTTNCGYGASYLSNDKTLYHTDLIPQKSYCIWKIHSPYSKVDNVNKVNVYLLCLWISSDYSTGKCVRDRQAAVHVY